MLNALEASFRQPEKLQKHIRFLFSHGALYTRVNGNLLYHGCIPTDENGEFEEVERRTASKLQGQGADGLSG